MEAKTKKRGILVRLDTELDVWLGQKALDGYKKAALIRKALHIYMDSDKGADAFSKQGDQKGDAIAAS